MEGKNLARDDSNKQDFQRAVGRDDMEVQPSGLRDWALSLPDCSNVTFKRLRNQRKFLLTGKKCHNHLQEGQGGDCGELKVGQLSLGPWKEYGAHPPRNHVQRHKEQDTWELPEWI